MTTIYHHLPKEQSDVDVATTAVLAATRARDSKTIAAIGKLVETTPGLMAYLQRVYGIATLGFGVALVCGLVATVADFEPSWPTVVVALLTMFGAVLWFVALPAPKAVRQPDGSLVAYDTPKRQLVAALCYSSVGFLTATTTMLIATESGAGVVLAAVVIVTANMAGVTLFAWACPKTFLLWGAPLVGALLGLIGISFLSLYYPSLLAFSTVFGIIVYSLLAVDDLDRIVVDYAEKEDADHLGSGLDMLMNVANLYAKWLRVLRLLLRSD